MSKLGVGMRARIIVVVGLALFCSGCGGQGTDQVLGNALTASAALPANTVATEATEPNVATETLARLAVKRVTGRDLSSSQ